MAHERAIDIVRPQTLIETTELAAASAAVLTHAGAGFQTRIKSIILHNHTGANRIATLRRVPDDDASANANQFYEATLAPNETVVLAEETMGKYGIVLDNVGDALHAFCDAINSVTITGTGVRV